MRHSVISTAASTRQNVSWLFAGCMSIPAPTWKSYSHYIYGLNLFLLVHIVLLQVISGGVSFCVQLHR